MHPSPSTLTTRRVNGVTVIELAGRLTLGGSASDLDAAINASILEGTPNILVNLAEVTYVDSSGVGKLTYGLKATAAAGGSLKLLHVNSRVAGLLKLTRVYTLFETFRDEEAALASFQATAN